jgi:hypothetical protein
MEKAIVFTHGFQGDPTSEAGLKTLNKKYKETFKAYLSCKNIGLVYVYISTGVEKFVLNVGSLKAPNAEQLEEEAREIYVKEEATMIQALQDVRQKALQGFQDENPYFNIQDTPCFIFIGIRELVSLLRRLILINPKLVENLAGPKGIRTYDTPKFVEAVIRIVRGTNMYLIGNPVLRIDADVSPSEKGVELILDKVFELEEQFKPFYFISGCYRGEKNLEEPPEDPLNDYAVRIHWFYAIDNNRNESYGKYKQFLIDLHQIGAKQLYEEDISSSCKSMLENRIKLSRNSLQVISGAGLVMSLRAILLLPPFMNMSRNIVWIDDFLKRVLHEMVGHISSNDVERVITPEIASRFPTARFIQDRGKPKEIQTVIDNSDYFQRVLRGCLMYSAITEDGQSSGPLAEAIKEGLERRLSQLDDTEENLLHNKLRAVMLKRGREVMEIWSNSGTDYGNDILENWCDNLNKVGISDKLKFTSKIEVKAYPVNSILDKLRPEFESNNVPLPENATVVLEPFSENKGWLIRDEDNKSIYIIREEEKDKKKIYKIYNVIMLDDIINDAINDAIAYVKLARSWSNYVSAIIGLQPKDCSWLYKRIK